MLLKAINANNETYDIDVLEAVKINGKVHNTVGMIQANNGVFLIFQNENMLASLDFTQIQNFVKNVQFEIKKPTLVEYEFIKFLTNNIQQKINNSEINPNELINVFDDVNQYIHINKELLNNMKQLDNKDEIVRNNRENLYAYFNDAMSNNKYFKKQEIIEETKEVEPEIIEDTIEQPVETPIMEQEKIVEEKKEVTYPPYDEATVTAILSSNPGENFDIDQFIHEYFGNLKLDQIDLLLNNFKLNENQIQALNIRKDTIKELDGQKVSKKKKRQKTKVHALPGRKEGKEAAFVDTLLLSFTIGTFCGIYLMYFVLTIMS